MRTDRAYVLHFQRPRLVAISTGRECTHRTNVDTHAALFALQMIFLVGCDQRTYTAILDPESPHVHALAAHPYAAVAENAARPIEEHNGRPLLLFFVILRLHEFGFGGAVAERHVL